MNHFKQPAGIILLLSALVLTGQGCFGGAPKAEQLAQQPVELTIWRVFDDEDTLQPAMNAYQAIHKNVSFNYRELRLDEYKDELLRAFAEGTGPDIFSVHNTWVGEYESLIAPLPRTLTIPYSEIKGTIKKETVVTLREEPTITARQLRSEFVDVVSNDVVRSYQPSERAEPEDRIFGLPLGVDTLAVFFNKDLLNAAGIAEPPKTWEEFQKAVTKLSRVGASDTVIQSGAAVGTSRNVERSFDILSLLMMQNGTVMIDDAGRAAFAEKGADRTLPGMDAARFYTDFANPLTEVYTWNKDQPPSFDAFVSGKAAMFFGYSYHLPLIRARAPKLNFGITSMPQIAGGRVVNYANYWVETVAKSSPDATWAWDFVQFATEPDQVRNYLAEAVKPTARRALINEQIENEDLSVFASQLLTAKSWYKGDDAEVAEAAFLDLIDATLAGLDLERAIQDAENKVNQTL